MEISDSKGVRLIKEYLNKNNIEYILEKRYSDCKDKNMLPFDFEISHNGEKILLEFDGSQHFKPKWGGIIYFNITKLHDEIKNNYCKNKNIKLIRIKHTEIQKINEILNKILNISNN